VPARVGRVHDVAQVDLADAGAAGNRRDDAGDQTTDDYLQAISFRTCYAA